MNKSIPVSRMLDDVHGGHTFKEGVLCEANRGFQCLQYHYLHVKKDFPRCKLCQILNVCGSSKIFHEVLL